MIRLSIATLALALLLLGGCAHQRNDTARSEFRRTETTHTREGTAPGAEMQPGDQAQQSETNRTQTHRESTTTTEIERR